MIRGRKVRLGLAATAVVALAAGCSNDPKGSTAPSDEDLGGQTVEVVAKFSGTEKETFEKVLAAFEKKTGAKVVYTSAGDNVPTFITSRLAGNNPPGVALLPQPAAAAEFAEKGALKPLTGKALEASKANYSKAWQDLGTIKGQVYGLYPKSANKSLCWYRTEAFKQAGVSEPKTWEEFKALAKKLTEQGITPFAVPGKSGWTLTDAFETLYIQVGGAENYRKLAKHEIPWTDPTVVETLKLLGELWSIPKAIDGGPSGALNVDFPASVANTFGDKPKAAIVCEAEFVAAEISKTKYKVGDTAKYFATPSVKSGGKSSVVTGGDMAVAMRDDKATMALMEYLASKEAGEILVKAGGALSPNNKVDLSVYPDATMRDLAKALLAAEALEFDMSDLMPTAFGGSEKASLWVLLQEFLGNPSQDVNALAQKLEAAAKKDYGR